MKPPAVWLSMTCYLELPPALATTWWYALSRARYARPMALRQAVLLFVATPIGSERGFVHTTCAPQALVQVLEDLVHERRLRRVEASRLETAILAHIDAQGHWT